MPCDTVKLLPSYSPARFTGTGAVPSCTRVLYDEPHFALLFAMLCNLELPTCCLS